MQKLKYCLQVGITRSNDPNVYLLFRVEFENALHCREVGSIQTMVERAVSVAKWVISISHLLSTNIEGKQADQHESEMVR
jgi:hypothetical protein